MHGSSPIPDRAWPRACSRWHPGVGRRPSGRGVVRFGHCRAGSSEREVVCRQESAPVHCRIGSSEMQLCVCGHVGTRSLPHRQLRNHQLRRLLSARCSLPHRQLRNLEMSSNLNLIRSLPHRQLRKIRADPSSHRRCSLPHRQLRKQPRQVTQHDRRSLPYRQFRE